MNTLGYLIGIEGSLLVLAILVLVVYEVSRKHPQAFKLPTLTIKSPFQNTVRTATIAGKQTWWDKLKADAALIWKPTEPEFFTSPDGNTLYLSLKYTDKWLPYQVVLYMLSQKNEFLDQIKAKDPTAFEAVNTLVDKLTQTNVAVAFKKMNILPQFQKNMLVWKLPLVDTPQVKLAEDVIVKELSPKM